jgi:hypothetical protein
MAGTGANRTWLCRSIYFRFPPTPVKTATLTDKPRWRLDVSCPRDKGSE